MRSEPTGEVITANFHKNSRPDCEGVPAIPEKGAHAKFANGICRGIKIGQLPMFIFSFGLAKTHFPQSAIAENLTLKDFFQVEAPNGLPITRVAIYRTVQPVSDSGFQNCTYLVAAQRRRGMDLFGDLFSSSSVRLFLS